MSNRNEQAEDEIIPVEQDSIPFYGHELVAVRLEDGRICAVLRWLCEGLSLDPQAQIRRIQRKTALTDGLVVVRVATEGGPQAMPALTLDVLPGWLFGIDENRVKPEARADIILFQRECAKVLAEYFARKRQPALPEPRDLVPAESVPVPEAPGPGASRAEWRTWRQAMRAWLEAQDELEAWREYTGRRQDALEQRQDSLDRRQDGLESRVEGVEELSRLFVEVTERLGPQTLTPEHQASVKAMAARLHELSGIAFATIYTDLNTAFHVARYADIPDARWEDVVAWLQKRIESAETRRIR